MRFRRHLSWNNRRAHGVMESLTSGDAPSCEASPAPMPPAAGAPVTGADGSQPPEAQATPGSTTLFYRLKGLMAHNDTKVSF